MFPQRKKSPRVALTGGMGCGKSTTGLLFEQLGWVRADADQWVREQVLKSPEVVNAAVRLMGETVRKPSGELDRSAIAHAVFTSPVLLKDWEAVIHPRVRELQTAWEQLHSDHPRLVEIPLLFENGLEKGFDFVVCVASSTETQYARLLERGMSRALAEQRISKQLPLATKIQFSHVVIWNDGSLAFLREQVAHVSGQLLG